MSYECEMSVIFENEFYDFTTENDLKIEEKKKNCCCMNSYRKRQKKIRLNFSVSLFPVESFED